MSDKPISAENPFANLTQAQCEQIQLWYQKHISSELNVLLKGSQSGKVIERKIQHALMQAHQTLEAVKPLPASTDTSIKLKQANMLAELKDTRDLFHSAQRKISTLEQQLGANHEKIQLLEKENSELKSELRSYRERLNHVLTRLEKEGVSFQKSHYVGRIFVHALRSSFHDWQQTPMGERFKNHDFYKLFPRVLYGSLLKEIELLLGETDYSRIDRTLSNFVFQHKGVPVQDWPDEDPIYQSELISQKQHELLLRLREQHQRRKNFALYLEKKLAKTGFTPMHGRLLVELIQFATTETDSDASFDANMH